jgi:polysaccharide export outer membrane protein
VPKLPEEIVLPHEGSAFHSGAEMQRIRFGPKSWLLILASSLTAVGCHQFSHSSVLNSFDPSPGSPRENRLSTIKEYIIRPPDVLVVDLVRGVPKPGYKLKPQDLVFIQVRGTPPEDPIKGVFRIEPEGIVRLGPAYGSIRIVDLNIDDATATIEKHLKNSLQNPQVTISLEETRGIQLVRGEHLVRPDGTVSLGIYGRVPVAGLTQEQAKAAIEQHLSSNFLDPSVSIDIAGFNSAVYYIVFDGGGAGEQIMRMPFTGNETVLDAIGQVSGLPAVAATNRVWLARPDFAGNPNEILPIDWRAITKEGRTTTNYQLCPGDRIYVAAQPLVHTDTFLARAIAPVERLFGVTLLGTSTVRSINTINQLNAGGIGVR